METPNLAQVLRCESYEYNFSIDDILKYKKSILTYYEQFYANDPIFLVTSVTNNSCIGFITSSSDFIEEICAYLDDYNCQDEESENFGEFETICFNSKFVKDL